MVAKRITELISAWQAFLKSARAAHSQTGKSIGSQFWECRRLRYGFGKLSRSDYYDYRLFDDALTFADKQRFVGFDTGFHINATLNKATWKVFADDKLLFYAACQGLEIPVPVLQGVFDVRRRRFGDVPVIATETELLMFLRERVVYPFFCKPSFGQWGDDTAAVESFDDERSELALLNGKRIALPTFVADLKAARGGYVIQELVRPHAELEAMCGPAVSTVRMMTITGEDGPKLFGAVWRIPSRGNWTDNFHKGMSGNMLGLIDPESGRVVRFTAGMGLTLREMERHPDTQAPMLGRILPNWAAARELALRGAASFPGYQFHHWDVAFSNRGPVALELNFNGGVDIYQLVSHRGVFHGLLEEAFRAATQKH